MIFLPKLSQSNRPFLQVQFRVCFDTTQSDFDHHWLMESKYQEVLISQFEMLNYSLLRLFSKQLLIKFTMLFRF